MKKIFVFLIIAMLAVNVFGATVIQIRRDSAANWTSVNPTLHQGELGFETDTLKLKIGDGDTNWVNLTYYSAGGVSGGSYAGIGDLLVDNDANTISITSLVTDLNAGTNITISCDGSDNNGTCTINSTASISGTDTNIFSSGVSDCNSTSFVFGFNSDGTTDCRTDLTGASGTDLIRTYSGVTPVTVDNDNNSVGLNITSSDDWNGTFDGQQGSYYLDFTNLTNKNFSLLVLDNNSMFDDRYNNTVDSNDIGRLDYQTIANPPWITAAGADTNAATECGDGLVLDGNTSCMPYVSTTAGNWTGTFDGNVVTDILNRANHLGTQLAVTISDFATAVLALFSGSGPITFSSGVIGFNWTSDFNSNWVDIFTGQNNSLLNNDSGYISSYNNLLRTYSGVAPVSVDNDNNSVGLNITSSDDWNGTFDGQQGSYYLDFTNLTNKNFSLLVLDNNSMFDDRYNNTVDSNNVGRLDYQVIGNPPFVPADSTIDTNQTAFDGVQVDLNLMYVQKGTTVEQSIDANLTASHGGGQIKLVPDQNRVILGTDPNNRLCTWYQDGNWNTGFC